MTPGEKQPKVGIALLAYNYGKYIDEAIDSLRAQTFQDFEVLLIDDGSNDDFTAEKLKTLKYEKITRREINKKNMGNAYRRREAYGMLRNQYILDMSGDDKLMSEFLEKTVKYLDEHPECGAVSVNLLEYMDDFSGEPFYEYKYDAKKMRIPEMLVECHFLGSSLMRKAALDETDLTGGFKRYLDWDKWISMLEAGWNLGLVPEPLFCYRVHADSLSHSSTAETEAEVFAQIVKKHSSLYKKYAPQVEVGLFHSLFATVRDNDEVLRENTERKKKINDLEEEISVLKGKIIDLEKELEICKRSFTNRLINKVKFLMECRRKHE